MKMLKFYSLAGEKSAQIKFWLNDYNYGGAFVTV